MYKIPPGGGRGVYSQLKAYVACKNEEDPIKNEGARVVTTLFIDYSDAQGQLIPKSVMESC